MERRHTQPGELSAEDLRIVRVCLHLHQAALAQFLEVHAPRVSDFELGRRRPSADQLRKLALLASDLKVPERLERIVSALRQAALGGKP